MPLHWKWFKDTSVRKRPFTFFECTLKTSKHGRILQNDNAVLVIATDDRKF